MFLVRHDEEDQMGEGARVSLGRMARGWRPSRVNEEEDGRFHDRDKKCGLPWTGGWLVVGQ